jgi:hypothetical protein
MSNSSRVVSAIAAILVAALAFGEAQGQASVASDRAAVEVRAADAGLMPRLSTESSATSPAPAAVNAKSLERGVVYLLSSATPIVLDPDPCHDVTQHPDPLSAGTSFHVSRSSAFNGVLWYEVRAAEGDRVLGWISADVLATLGVTGIS